MTINFTFLRRLDAWTSPPSAAGLIGYSRPPIHLVPASTSDRLPVDAMILQGKKPQ